MVNADSQDFTYLAISLLRLNNAEKNFVKV